MVKDHFFDLDFYRPYLLGAAGAMAAARLLPDLISNKDCLRETIIIQSSLRKFVSSKPIGIESKRYPFMRVVESGYIAHTDIFTPSLDGFLIPNPIELGSMSHQYAVSHRLEDLLRYSAICCSTQVLTPNECLYFLSMPMLIPGGIELGSFPASVWLPIVQQLSIVNLEFCRSHVPASLDKYQRRAIAFCSERLGSYLLIKSLNSLYGSDLPPQIFGAMVSAVDNGEYQANYQ
jgi:hypothetical protein